MFCLPPGILAAFLSDSVDFSLNQSYCSCGGAMKMYDKLLKDPTDVPHDATFKVDWVLNKIKAYIRLNGEKMLVLITK